MKAQKFDTLVTLDFETYYSQQYSLRKMTTEEYIRHPDFHAQMCGIKINSEPTFVVPSGDLKHAFAQFNWRKTAALAHHAHFDGLILSHHYGVQPKHWFDTLSMARAIHGTQVGGSLAKLATHYNVGAKGKELANAMGIRDLPPALYESMAGYCANDVELTFALFLLMRNKIPKMESEVIDIVVKMFTRPTLRLDGKELKTYIEEEQKRKATLITDLQAVLGADSEDDVKDMLMSNQKFAAILEAYGVEPPMKVSPAIRKPTLALAKTDKGMTDLLEHENETVRDLAAARLGTKSTINETRAIRMMDMGSRGPACVYLNFSGAEQTHRLSGGDKMNWQNFPQAKKARLRHAIQSPRGTKLVAVDSSNIELRVNHVLAGQRSTVDLLRAGEDLYCDFASQRYKRVITKADTQERQYGKVCHLALGYGMGDAKFATTARLWGLKIDDGEALQTVRLYRSLYAALPRWWYAWQEIIPTLASGRTAGMHEIGIRVGGGMIQMDGFLPLRYPDLRQDADGEWTIQSRHGRTKVYGAKLVENITQWIARNIVMEQTVTIAKRFPVVMSVHDEVVYLCRDGEEDEALAFGVEVMSRSPDWFPQIPLGAEGHAATSYGDCK